MRVLVAIVVALALIVAVSVAANLSFVVVSPTPVVTEVVEPAGDDGEREALEAALGESQARVAKLEEEAAANAAAGEAMPVEVVAEEEMTPEPEADEPDGTPPTLDEIREKVAGNPMAKAQITALAELSFSDFLNALDVEPDVKAQVREIIGASYLENIALTQFAMVSGDKTWAEVKGWQLEERAYLSEQLAAVLSDEAYATWEAYVPEIEVRELEGSLRSQIQTMSSGLTPENFQMVMDVAVEEFRGEQIALEQSEELFTAQENIRYQLRAIDGMRERVQGVMEDGQTAELENFLTMAETVLTGQLDAMEASEE